MLEESKEAFRGCFGVLGAVLGQNRRLLQDGRRIAGLRTAHLVGARGKQYYDIAADQIGTETKMNSKVLNFANCGAGLLIGVLSIVQMYLPCTSLHTYSIPNVPSKSSGLAIHCLPLLVFNSCPLLNNEGEDSDMVSSFRTCSPRAFS
jgi:hypothetical protein